MKNEKLKEYFNFDEGDLTANRAGSLTERQRTRLEAELRSMRRKKTLMAYFMFFLALVGVIGAIAIWFVPESSWGLRLGFGIGFGIVWPLAYLFMGFLFLPPAGYLNLELANEKGRANIVRVQSSNSTSHTTSSRYDLYIGNRRFVTDHRVGGVIMQGEEYIVYYLKNSGKIVSAEYAGK
jgi:hypothetical protein